ncbi:hypothetical protein ACTJKO_07690 [Curtobacterium sp. 22159]|uniref:hypothetical protein n=1 Tax=Curtobacterium sp. 22159 TaxID=3453882 RepID=UPI003F873E6A
MSFWGSVGVIALQLLPIVISVLSALIAYRAYRVTRHYRDPIWVITFDRQLPPGSQYPVLNDGSWSPTLQLRLENHGPDTARNVSVEAKFDPTDIKRFAADWTYVEANGSRTWQVHGFMFGGDWDLTSQGWDDWVKVKGRSHLRVTWKGPQWRRQRADVPLPLVADLPRDEQGWLQPK